MTSNPPTQAKTIDQTHMEVVERSARLARKRAFRVRCLLAPLSMMHILRNIALIKVDVIETG